jgi:hypothetical protein
MDHHFYCGRRLRRHMESLPPQFDLVTSRGGSIGDITRPVVDSVQGSVGLVKQRTVLVLMSATAVTVALLGLPASGASASRKADVALARKALIVKSDFPKGWTTSSNGGNTNKNLGVPQMLACLGLPASIVNLNPPEADSPTFNQNSLGQSVDDSVDVFPSVKVADEELAIYGSTDSAKCVAQAFDSASVKAVFARQLGTGSKVGNATVISLAKPVATNNSLALELRIPFTYKGEHFILASLNVIIMAKSGVEGSELVFSNPSTSPFSATLVKHLESVTVQRLG